MAKKVAKAKRTVAKRTKKVAAKRVAAKKKPAKAKPRTAAKAKPARAKKKPAPKAPARRVAAKAAKPKVAPRPVRRAAAPVAIPNPLRELAKRIVSVTLANDDDAAFAFYDESIESTEMGMPPVKGIDGLRQKYAQWRAMAGDSTWRARSVWVDGNTIVIEWAGRATINGNPVDLKEIAIHEVRNGKIVRERYYYDTTPFQPSAQALTQPPAEPEPSPAPPTEPGF